MATLGPNAQYGGNRGLLSVQDFMTKLQSISYQQSIDVNLLRDVAMRFTTPQSPQMMNYEEFMKALGFEFEKYKLLDIIFLTMQAALQQVRVPTLKDLFGKVSPQMVNYNLPYVDKDTFQNVLKAAGGVLLKPYEL